MKRQDEFLLNQEVKELLAAKGVTDPQAQIIGYKLGHKYIDSGITTALPVIVEKLAETKDMNYRIVSRMVYKVLPIKTTTKAKETPVVEWDGRSTSKPFAEYKEYFSRFKK